MNLTRSGTTEQEW